MALGDTIKRLFSNDEDDLYEDSYNDSSYQEQPQHQQPVQQTSQQQAAYFGRQSAQSTMTDPSNANSKIALFEPKVYSDSRDIASQILGGEAVIVNFTQIDEAQAKRILDFLGGAIYAVNGEIERIGQSIFLVTPATFEISGTLTDNLEPNTRY
ncbi:cell division protein SepF [Leuconostoc gelidum subsp. gasicomitatum]|uniref:cell division protein SepF n=1 Tax=Leuconostoc gasicomitatum TaxID=115778 RepID=UPI0007E12002|nr:cell division protein SepF [Leuconostoc gasicomitatum]MBZ5948353.1 cell division protein SepF [Leuconostoc gasicomitatum]CUW12489.1 FIG001960: FtsZ-interacting protein related to cell division [Leuconostoc gasicomitatum]